MVWMEKRINTDQKVLPVKWFGEYREELERLLEQQREEQEMQYAHGGDIYTYKNLLDLSINVNPLGPADAVVEAAARSLQRIGEYPDSQSRELRNALAEKKGLAAEQFVIGNGAAALLFSLVLAEKPQKAMIVIPAFSEYEQALKTVGCEILYHEVKKENNFRLGTDLTEKITSELDFLFLCSPSNPAGQAVEKEFLIKIAEKCEKERVRLVLDECFVQFLTSGEEASMQLETGRFRYLFVLQAFTKIYAVPGIRLGYGISSDKALLERMETVRQPWSVSTPAQAAGLSALKEDHREEQTRQLVKSERERMEKELENLRIEYIPSEANFLLFNSEINWFEELKKRGILIRDCANYRGLGNGWYRLAVRLPEENDRLLECMKQVLNERS